MLLQDKVVVVTGAGRGIGRAHARTTAAHGARVVVNDVADADGCAERLRADGYDAVADSSDISTFAGAKTLIQKALSAYGQLDGLVNNAGVLRRADVADLDEAGLDLEFAVNLKGSFACTRFASEYWRGEARAGRPRDAAVVNTASDTIFTGSPGGTGYAATKAAVVALTQSASLEGIQYGVRHNAIAPSGRTPMAGGSGLLAFGSDGIPVPEEMDFAAPDNPLHNSPLVVWLLSDLARNVTGQVFRLRFGSFARMDRTTNGPWVTPPDSAVEWDAAALAGVVEDASFPEPMREYPDRPAEPFARLDHH